MSSRVSSKRTRQTTSMTTASCRSRCALTSRSSRRNSPAWMREFIMRRGTDVLRSKGILSLKGQDRRYVFQGIHMVMDSDWGPPWAEDESRIEPPRLHRPQSRRRGTAGRFRGLYRIMSLAETTSYDFGARMVSPLLDRAEHRARRQRHGRDRQSADGEPGRICARRRHRPAARHRRVTAPQAGDSATAKSIAVRHSGAATALLPFHGGFVSAGQDGQVVRYAADGSRRSAGVRFRRGDGSMRLRSTSGTAVSPRRRSGAWSSSIEDGRSNSNRETFPSTISGLSFAPEGRRIAVAHLDGVSILSARRRRRASICLTGRARISA